MIMVSVSVWRLAEGIFGCSGQGKRIDFLVMGFCGYHHLFSDLWAKEQIVVS